MVESDRGGFTTYWRKRWQYGYHQDHLLWCMMDWFIDFAAWEDKKVFFRQYVTIEIKRGEVIFGTISMAKFFKTTRDKIRSRLKILENCEFLTIRSTNKFSVATITNYEKYQSALIAKSPSKAQTDPQQIPNRSPQSKEVKEYKEYNIKSLCEAAYKTGFKSVYAFSNKMLSLKKHPAAIEQALSQYLKIKPKDPWAYCCKIVGVESGNFCEADYVAEAQRQKKEFDTWILKNKLSIPSRNF